MYEKPEIDFRDWLASVSDPEERARFAREGGHTDRWHRRTPSMCAGGGFHASVNGCITGAKGSTPVAPNDGEDDNA
ncbi:hypothetical protein [Sphingomonas glacialis]|uniref:hypothetical protein n=1 Tax=Sphingomonas glacialis TaxID=658225 RepID=UPI0013873744|nr:hypothetical protein [Sphingomonas glacialis]